MVVKISVLGQVQRSGGKPFDGSYFVKLARSNYYLKGGEPPGRWFGGGARALGLLGVVGAEDFANVLAGRRPDGSALNPVAATKSRGRRAKKSQLLKPTPPAVPGYDLCFSAPKSVSVLWAAASPQDRDRIERAFNVAVTSTLEWLVANIPLARRGKAGRFAEYAEPAVGLFPHGTARPNDEGRWEPQLHKHCVFANIALGADGQWSAVNSRKLHDWARTLGPMFRATLSRELQSLLGVAVVRPKDRRGELAGWFEIAGVPGSLCKYWSSRTNEIEALIAGGDSVGNTFDARAREVANLRTRNAKGDVPPRQQLFEDWEKVASKFGLTKETIEGLKGRTLSEPVDPEKAFQLAWQTAREQMDASQSSFTYREVVQRVCEAAQTFGVGGDWLASRTKQELDQSPQIRPLGYYQGDDRYATEHMWQIESELLEVFKALRATPGAHVNESALSNLSTKYPHLLADQKEALESLLSSTTSLRILTGVAGAGKSTALDVLREVLEEAGFQVIGGAIAAVAKEELAEKAHIPTRTVASYLHHLDKSPIEKFGDRLQHDLKQLVRAAQGKSTHKQQVIDIEKNTVLILDEAGMMGSETLLKLADIVSKRKATLILVGDTAQLQPITAGGPLLHLANKEGVPHLTTNLRQRDEADRKASEDLRDGDAQAALKSYADRGKLTVSPNRTDAITTLISTWKEAGGTRSPKDHVIFAPTRVEVEAANSLAQRAREAAGLIDQQQSLTNGRGRICRGDRVLFHRNVFADGVRNGYRGEVMGVDRFSERLTIRLDGKQRREVTINLRDYGPEGLTLAYAQTVHKSQGQSVEHSYILVGGSMADREMAYVQATRGVKTTQLFVDELHAGDDLKDLARSLSRSKKKELAHDIAAKAATLTQKRLSPELEF